MLLVVSPLVIQRTTCAHLT